MAGLPLCECVTLTLCPAGSPLTEFDDPLETERLVLSDLINRVLDKGVVISGHVTVSIADIDLLAIDLRLLLTSVQTALERGMEGSRRGHTPLLPPDSAAT